MCRDSFLGEGSMSTEDKQGWLCADIRCRMPGNQETGKGEAMTIITVYWVPVTPAWL